MHCRRSVSEIESSSYTSGVFPASKLTSVRLILVEGSLADDGTFCSALECGSLDSVVDVSPSAGIVVNMLNVGCMIFLITPARYALPSSKCSWCGSCSSRVSCRSGCTTLSSTFRTTVKSSRPLVIRLLTSTFSWRCILMSFFSHSSSKKGNAFVEIPKVPTIIWFSMRSFSYFSYSFKLSGISGGDCTCEKSSYAIIPVSQNCLHISDFGREPPETSRRIPRGDKSTVAQNPRRP